MRPRWSACSRARIPPSRTYRYPRRCYGSDRDRGPQAGPLRALAGGRRISPPLLCDACLQHRHVARVRRARRRRLRSHRERLVGQRPARGRVLAERDRRLPRRAAPRHRLAPMDPRDRGSRHAPAVFFVLPFATSPFQIVALAFAAGMATSLFRPAVYAGLPNLVSDEDLPQANGLLQTADNFTWAIGALVGGGLVAATSPDAAYLVNAFSFLVSALLIVRIRQSLEEAERAPSRGHWRDLAEGFSFALRSKSLLTIIVAWSIAIFATAGVNVAEIVLAKNVFYVRRLRLRAPRRRRRRRAHDRQPLRRAAGSSSAGMALPYGVSIGLMALGFGAAAAAPERLGCRGRGRRRRRRKRRRGDHERRARPARRARPPAREVVRGRHEPRLRLPRPWHDRRRPA